MPHFLKMEFEEDHYVLNAYSATLAAFEYTEFLFHNKQRDYTTILQELKNCCSKIEFLVTLETDHNDTLTALYQQKQHFVTLIDTVEKIIEEETKIKTVNCPSVELSQCNRSSYLSPQRSNVKKRKTNENENLNIVINTSETPKVSGLHEIVGLHDIKKVLKSIVLLPKTQPQLFESRRLCNSILLFGPPGTGKTRLAHALAAEANATFHCISASDILSHYVGQTEKNIKVLFQHLQSSRTFSILFIDEIDAFCRKRTENEQEHTRRVKTELMCQMTASEESKSMFVICATNCPWDLDVAILRRFQKRIYVPLPNQLERFEFFQHFIKNMKFEHNSEQLSLLLNKTDGYSGSDLYSVIQAALNIPVTELLDTKIWKISNEGFYEPVSGEHDLVNVICSELNDLPVSSVKARPLKMVDLLNALDQIPCTVSAIDIKKYERFINRT